MVFCVAPMLCQVSHFWQTMLVVIILSVVILSVTMLVGIMLRVVFLNVTMLVVVMLSVVILNVTMLVVIKLSVVILSVTVLFVIMLSVAVPCDCCTQWKQVMGRYHLAMRRKLSDPVL